MNRRQVVLSALALLGVPATSFALDAAGDPEQWILEISGNILDLIRKDTKLAAADPARVRKFVDETVMPVIDFLRMTRMAVGPKWRGATAEQRQQLQTQFQEQLIRVYSGALATVKDQTIRLAPNRVAPTPTDAIVRTLLTAPGKPDMHINYRLKKVDGQWRIIDVDVEGIWLVDNYRSQFSGIVNSSGIDGLIESLKQKNASSGA